MEKVKSLIPLDEIESGALDQLRAMAKHEFVEELVVMPDIHQGYELPIGTVAKMKGVISSACVGYDISCGMLSAEFGFTKGDVDIERIKTHIVKRIPMGFNSREHSIQYSAVNIEPLNKPMSEMIHRVNGKTMSQLGTLGGGNHFIELGESELSHAIGVTIHSGSRNAGHTIASFFNKYSDEGLPNGYYYTDSDMGKAYIHMMNFADTFARNNRHAMMEEIEDIFRIEAQLKGRMTVTPINESHNHAIINSDGSVIHRKGATAAEKGQLGVIPINMRDGVYITKGLGNKEWLESASHGAGRVMSRKKAKKTIDYDAFKASMEHISSNITQSQLDEAPDAYKDADYVISAQEGVTVEIVDHYSPLMVLKG